MIHSPFFVTTMLKFDKKKHPPNGECFFYAKNKGYFPLSIFSFNPANTSRSPNVDFSELLLF